MPKKRRLLVAGAIALLAGGSAHAGVEDGVRKWRAGDYTGAVAEWRKPAEKGERDAQFNLGQAYKLGRGVPADPDKAVELYRKAAAQGHEPAEANLGWLLFQQGKREEAIPLLQRAAARGDAHGQYLLGIAYFNGDALPRDWPRAYRLMTAAAATGLPQAKDALISMEARIPLAERQKALAQKPAAPDTPAAPVARAGSAAAPPPPASPPPPATPAVASGQWRVQLGAFSSRKAATAAWSALSAKHRPLAALSPYYVSKDAVVRLQAGPLPDRKSAAELCSTVSGQTTSCFPALP